MEPEKLICRYDWLRKIQEDEPMSPGRWQPLNKCRIRRCHLKGHLGIFSKDIQEVAQFAIEAENQ